MIAAIALMGAIAQFLYRSSSRGIFGANGPLWNDSKRREDDLQDDPLKVAGVTCNKFGTCTVFLSPVQCVLFFSTVLSMTSCNIFCVCNITSASMYPLIVHPTIYCLRTMAVDVVTSSCCCKSLFLSGVLSIYTPPVFCMTVAR